MSLIEKSVTISVPVRTAYNQWTQFEDFPKFMEGVVSVKQLGNQQMHWRSNIAGVEREFEVEIVEQIPDTRIAWRTLGGEHHSGVITFHRLNDHQTRVMLQMEYDPQGAIEKVGDMVGMTSRRIEKDLERFKEFVERRGTETGAWRGEIDRPG